MGERKKNLDKLKEQVYTSVSSETMAELKTKAEQRGVSVSVVVREFIEQGLHPQKTVTGNLKSMVDFYNRIKDLYSKHFFERFKAQRPKVKTTTEETDDGTDRSREFDAPFKALIIRQEDVGKRLRDERHDAICSFMEAEEDVKDELGLG